MLSSSMSTASATCTSRICSWTNYEPGCNIKQVLWLWLAIDPLTKMIPVLHVGPRTQRSAYTVIHSLRQILTPGCVPLFTSDGLNLYFYAALRPFWTLAQD